MADPRKPVITPSAAQQEQICDGVHSLLLTATEVAGSSMGLSGCSFVLIGMGVWAMELAELDAGATANVLRALADMVDPQSDDDARERAEANRRAATDTLFAALDLEMAEAQGNG